MRPARRGATPAACCAPTSSTRSRSSPSPRPSRRRRCSTRWSGGPSAPIAELELPYRIIEICTGDMGQSHHRSFDIEVYAPGCDQWLEVSSVSWFSDYQARRANVRYRVDGREGHAARAHAERFGARRAAGVGGDRREPAPGRRLDRRARGAAPVHARHRCDRLRDRRTSIDRRRRDPRSAGAVRDGRARRRRCRPRPDGAVAAVARRRVRGRRGRAERDDARHRRRRWHARRPDRARPRRRRARLRVLHELRERQEPPARSARRGVGRVQLARPAPSGSGARSRRAARRRRRATPTSRRGRARARSERGRRPRAR